jgi:hypothetical protein
VIQRALASKRPVAHVLACATGITLYFRWSFPEDDVILRLISIRAPFTYAAFRYTHTLFLFTTAYIADRFLRMNYAKYAESVPSGLPFTRST